MTRLRSGAGSLWSESGSYSLAKSPFVFVPVCDQHLLIGSFDGKCAPMTLGLWGQTRHLKSLN